ncbi:TPA: DUF3892 domain-containing protein [bacterium]|jgi:hypothetical protein|nr:DUF3892 domain-containing protein [bacterium]
MYLERERIVKVRRDNHGRIVEFMTDKGSVYDVEMAKEAITNDLITNAELYKGKDGLMHIKSLNDNTIYSSFDEMEEF